MATRLEMEIEIRKIERKSLTISHLSYEYLGLVQDCTDYQRFPVETFCESLARYVVQRTPECGSDLEDVLENVMRIAATLGKKPQTRALILSSIALTSSLIHAFAAPEIPIVSKKTLLKIIATTCRLSISPEIRAAVRQKLTTDLQLLAAQLSTVGEYEAQVAIVEVLVRYLGHTDYQAALRWFNRPDITKRFCSLDIALFEPMCRPFLNYFNENCGDQRSVFSFACIKMTAGERIIQKPNDDIYSDLWVDFNLLPKSIWVYCSKTATDDKWETIIIEAQDILQHKISYGRDTITLDIHLKKEAYLVFDSTKPSQFSGFIVEMVFSTRYPISTIMELISPSMPSGELIGNSQSHSKQPVRSAQTLLDPLSLRASVENVAESNSFSVPSEEIIGSSQNPVMKPVRCSKLKFLSALKLAVDTPVNESNVVIPIAETDERSKMGGTPMQAATLSAERSDELEAGGLQTQLNHDASKLPVCVGPKFPLAYDERSSGGPTESAAKKAPSIEPTSKPKRGRPPKNQGKPNAKARAKDANVMTANAKPKKSRTSKITTNTAKVKTVPEKKEEVSKAHAIEDNRRSKKSPTSDIVDGPLGLKRTTKADAKPTMRKATKSKRNNKTAKSFLTYKPVARNVSGTKSSSKIPRAPLQNLTNASLDSIPNPVAHSTRNHEASIRSPPPKDDNFDVHTKSFKFFKNKLSKTYSKAAKPNIDQIYSIFDNLSTDGSDSSSSKGPKQKSSEPPLPQEEKSVAPVDRRPGLRPKKNQGYSLFDSISVSSSDYSYRRASPRKSTPKVAVPINRKPSSVTSGSSRSLLRDSFESPLPTANVAVNSFDLLQSTVMPTTRKTDPLAESTRIENHGDHVSNDKEDSLPLFHENDAPLETPVTRKYRSPVSSRRRIRFSPEQEPLKKVPKMAIEENPLRKNIQIQQNFLLQFINQLDAIKSNAQNTYDQLNQLKST